MKRYSFNIQGQQIEGYAQRIKNQIWVHINGRTFVSDISDQSKLSLRSSSRGRLNKSSFLGNVSAPMPGKISKVLVIEGQAIQKGQALVVMEAMKMEYTLKSERENQIVKKIFVKVAQQVALGDVLLELDDL